ncbi:transposase domain-containing protein [Candidatus Spongiihabitans sp.]
MTATQQKQCASATCYSLVESAKANDLEPYAYLQRYAKGVNGSI